MREFSNKQLIKLIQAESNEEAFKELFNRYHGKIRQLLSYKVPLSSIDDLMQEIFITVFTNVNQLRKPDKFESWLNQIIYTKLNDYYRDSYKDKEEKSSLEQESQILLDTFLVSASSEDVVITKFKLSDIHDIIVKLPSEKIEAFLLHHLHDMSYDEIAVTTDEKHSTVRGKIARAKINIFNEIFRKSTPKKIRESISTKISHLVSDGEHLRHYLKTDYFENHLIREILSPVRIAITKPKIYFFRSLENIMLLFDVAPHAKICLIKVKSKVAIPILLNRISTNKKLHCVFLSTEYMKDAKKYLEFITDKTMNYSFFASPLANIAEIPLQPITQSSIDNTTILNYLTKHDPSLDNIINAALREYGHNSNKYKFFTANNSTTREISAYAFFLQVDTYLWELCRYISFDKSDKTYIKDCIAAGTHELLSLNYHISSAGVSENNKIFLEIAPRLGFEVAYRFVSGTIKIK